jgi:hypothetical protein
MLERPLVLPWSGRWPQVTQQMSPRASLYLSPAHGREALIPLAISHRCHSSETPLLSNAHPTSSTWPTLAESPKLSPCSVLQRPRGQFPSSTLHSFIWSRITLFAVHVHLLLQPVSSLKTGTEFLCIPSTPLRIQCALMVQCLQGCSG